MSWFRLTMAVALGLAASAASAELPGDLDPSGWLGRARIGVQVQPMTPELREFLDAPRDRGVLVVRVLEDSPAAKAGVQVGDVVTAIDGEAIDQPYELVHAVAIAAADEDLPLSLSRKGKALAISVTPEGRALPWPGTRSWDELGQEWRRGLRHGAEGLREKLRDLERRLEELERDRELDPARPT